ncbi:MAG: DUF4388 domain-containing protein [Myxococcales bacterium]|nr:DUF4388 domain-containing protein [Myxococcales bacterium]
MRRAGFRVTVAGSPEQALWFLDHALPIAIVSANRFTDGMSSKAFAELIRGAEEWTSIVLVMLADPGGNEALALADDVVGDGVTIASLCACLRHALLRRRVDAVIAGEGPRQLRGELVDMTPIDLLRLVERLGESGTLGVETPAGPVTLWFKEGRVIDAVFGRFEGEEAVLRLLMAESGAFELSIGPIFHTEVISGSSERLLSECLRQLDEWMRLCEEMPPLDTHLWVDHELFGRKRAALSAEQLALIRSCDGGKTIRSIVEESGLDLLLALEALRNLKVEGILIERRESVSRWGGAGLGVSGDDSALPELPALPEPFPGLDASAGVEEEAPLVSGIPEEHPEDEGAGGEADGAGGLVRLSRVVGKSERYVFRPPERSADGDASSIGQAISEAISGGEQLTKEQGLSLSLGAGRWVTPAPVERAPKRDTEPDEAELTSGLRRVFAQVASGASAEGRPSDPGPEAAKNAVLADDVVELAAGERLAIVGEVAKEHSTDIEVPTDVGDVARADAGEGGESAETPRTDAVAVDVAEAEQAGVPGGAPSKEIEGASEAAPGASSEASWRQELAASFEDKDVGEVDEDAPGTSEEPDDDRSNAAKVLPLLRARRHSRGPVKVPAIEGLVLPPRGLTRAISTGEIGPESEGIAVGPAARQEAMSVALERPSVVLQPGVEAEVVTNVARLTQVSRAANEDGGGGASAAYLRLVPESSGDFSRLSAFADGRPSASGARLGLPRSLDGVGPQASASASYPLGGSPQASASASYPLSGGAPSASTSASYPLSAGSSASYPLNPGAPRAATSASYPFGPPPPRPAAGGGYPFGAASQQAAVEQGLPPAFARPARRDDPFDADELAAIRGSRTGRWILLLLLLVAAGGVVAWVYYPEEVEALLGIEPPAEVIDEDEAP